MKAQTVIDAAKTFLAVLLVLAGGGVAAAAVLLYLLTGSPAALWYLAIGAGFVTAGVLVLRWRPLLAAHSRVEG
jgi:hypothetical protein